MTTEHFMSTQHATPAAQALDYIGRNIARLTTSNVDMDSRTMDQFQASLAFLELVPPELATPTCATNGHGQVFFCWETETLSLAIIPDEGEISYAAEFGRVYKQGREKFGGSVMPVVILQLMSAFKRCDA